MALGICALVSPTLGTRVFVALLVSQVLHGGARGQAEADCRPAVQHDGPLGEVPSHQGMRFEGSQPDVPVEGEGRPTPRRGERALSNIHGEVARTDDIAEVTIIKAPPTSSQTLRQVLALGPGYRRRRRALLVPPMFVPENQRAPFPRVIGKSHVISADEQGSHIFRLTGRGADQDPKGAFSIDQLTGEVTVNRALDREDIAFYQLQVSTTDQAGKVLEGPVPLDVSLIDQNDNRPVFTETRYAGEVLEGSPAGTTVMTVTAWDADDPNTDNAALRYSLAKQSPDLPSPSMFYIDPEKGHVVTATSVGLLDREALPTTQYELEIVAKDMAGSDVGLTGTATATITIADKNDHAPKFTQSLFQATVRESWRGAVLTLTVEDRDEVGTGAWRAMFSILGGDSDRSFEVHTNPDNNHGMLSVVEPLDYESSAFHSLLIKVENEDPLVADVGYSPISTATVYVTVLDVNEGPVFFPDPMAVTRRENIPAGSTVAMLNATDPDLLQAQHIRFAVLNDPAGWLSVDPVTGMVNTTAILDRESPFVHDNTYRAVFTAVDDGSPPATGSGTLVITLEDENDNAPYIYPPVARVCEDAKDPNVLVLGGMDRDIDPNGAPFSIQLAKQPGLETTWNITSINSTHSQVTLLHRLQRASYLLPLQVTDSGAPPLSRSAQVTVQVCTCRRSRMDCSRADYAHSDLLVLGPALLTALAALSP
ncbi:cadherin-13-like isoform X2 [Anguilla anguilla]|uniref:cadherin-13-like isoform X2 n=1 Tax=Anguilla anguilla TaxID=7936 RepID=UPI0015AA3A97|nr:cadherin-13-like isoform X2 [Anguilla anguilla]